jgi:4-oxalocrotonate tautomerase
MLVNINGLTEHKEIIMPLINVKLIEGVLNEAQKKQIVTQLTDTMVAIEGESMRSVTWVVIEEVKSGHWAIGGRCRPPMCERCRRGAPRPKAWEECQTRSGRAKFVKPARLPLRHLPAPNRRRHAEFALERARKGRLRFISAALGNSRNLIGTGTQGPSSQRKPPARKILHERLADHVNEAVRERRTRQRHLPRKLLDRPSVARLSVQQRKRAANIGVAQPRQPTSSGPAAGIGYNVSRLR